MASLPGALSVETHRNIRHIFAEYFPLFGELAAATDQCVCRNG
jgi:hypothetical protein